MTRQNTQEFPVRDQRPAEPESAVASLVRRVRSGDVGSLPVILGLILIAIIFQAANRNFITPLNLTNLMVQIAAVGTISVGIVLVLLIGEIDLSAGAVSGLAAGVLAVTSVKQGLPAPVAILAGILTGTLIGLLQGWWVAKLHVPSFVVTLAGFLGWQGALLYVLGDTGTINLNDRMIVGLSNLVLPVAVGWVLAILFAAIFCFNLFSDHNRRARLGLVTQPVSLLIARAVLVTGLIFLMVGLMSVNRNPGRNVVIQGVPLAVVLFIAFIILFDFITRRTRFGRSVFAVGGSPEAARRAGINVDRVRILIFTLCSSMAAMGGLLAASRLYAVNQSSGGGDILLNAIAAAVIGGTSLFGGRGNTWSALLGALVIGSIANGMDLLAFSSSIRFMVTGAVLLLSVTLDAYTRSRREQSGR